MEMVSHTADTQRFCVQVATDRRNIGVHSRPNVAVQPCFTIFGAEDNMNDDFAKRLRHYGIVAEKNAQVNRAVSADEFFLQGSWGAAPGYYKYRAVGAKQILCDAVNVSQSKTDTSCYPLNPLPSPRLFPHWRLSVRGERFVSAIWKPPLVVYRSDD